MTRYEQKHALSQLEHLSAKSRILKIKCCHFLLSFQIPHIIIYMKISEWERSYCELLEWEKAEDRTVDERMRVGGRDGCEFQRAGRAVCHPSSRNRKWVKTSLLTFWPLQITFPPSPIPAAVWSPSLAPWIFLSYLFPVRKSSSMNPPLFTVCSSTSCFF